MKIFVIGGATVSKDSPEYESELDQLQRAMGRLGGDIVERGHDLVVCSPFEASADLPAISGASKRLSTCLREGPSIEIHFPKEDTVASEIDKIKKEFGSHNFRLFSHPTSKGPGEEVQWKYSWLLSQIAALESSHGVIALGGKFSGTASMLLTMATTKFKKILPLAFLDGAAAQTWQALRWELNSKIDGGASLLLDPKSVDDAVELIEAFSSGDRSVERNANLRFFISYPRARPHEADFLEMTLRRRKLDVYRDESNFAAGGDLPSEISAHIERSNVFVVIWCKEYACSPWCYDEFDAALRRHEAGKNELWIFCVDETRIVPRAARSLVTYPSYTREQFEKNVLKLLESDAKPV